MYGKVVAIVALSLAVTAPVLPAVAQDGTGSATDTVEVVESADDAGILPTNPFYFLKEWARGLRRAFIFNPVKRAEFELRVTDEKARELGEVSELDGEDRRGIDRAAVNYEEAVERLRMRLEKVGENSDNPNVQELLQKLAERAEAHRVLIERVRARYGEFEDLRLRMEQIGENIEGAIGSVGEGAKVVEELRGRVRIGDSELRTELKEKLEEFKEGVLRGRLELRERVNGEEIRLRFENRFRLNDDGGRDEAEDVDDDDDLNEDDDDLDEDDDNLSEDRDDEDENGTERNNSGRGGED